MEKQRSPKRATQTARLLFLIAVLCGLVYFFGRQQEPIELLKLGTSPDKPGEAEGPEPPPPEVATSETSAPEAPDQAWVRLAAEAGKQLRRGALSAARQSLAELSRIDLELTPEQTRLLAGLHFDLAARLQVRAYQAAQASKPMGTSPATSSVGQESPSDSDPASGSPSASSTKTVTADRERLRETIALLGSEDRDQVRGAENQLFANAPAAMPLLLESLQDENPQLAFVALKLLLKLAPPEVNMPAMLGTLHRTESAHLWPLVVGELDRLETPGAGEALLQLALDSPHAAQRVMALKGLSRIVDPPRRTFIKMLPLLEKEGPELAPALLAATHAVIVHHQHDLVSRRGLDLELTSEQLAQIRNLPQRLSTMIDIAGNATSDPAEAEIARAARSLAIATRIQPAEPLKNVTILAYSSEMPDGPVQSVLDGDWATADPKQMWRHSIAHGGSLVVDLGAERTVVGLRIWNLNEPGGTHRGWKDVAVYVGPTPTAEAVPVATGLIPQAPGAKTSADYSSTIPVPFVQGRFLRIEADSVWRPDAYAGLSELQVLGF